MWQKTISKIKSIFIPCEDNEYRPEFLKSNFLYCYVILLLVLKIVIIPFFIYFPKTIFFADISRIALINYVNEERESLGLSILKNNPKLDEAAYLKAKDILDKDYFSHQSPEGITPWHWFKEAGYKYRFAGENLAIGFIDSEEVNQAWLDSPSHKENIVNPNYKEIGIATMTGNFNGKETTVVVQLFGTLQTGETNIQKKVVKESPTEESSTGTLPIKNESNQPKELLSTFQEQSADNGLVFNIFSFLSSDYYNLLQKVIYSSIIFILLSLLITLFFDIFIHHAFKIQYKDIVFKSAMYVLLLVVMLFIDKGVIIQFIPHSLSI